MRRFIFTFIHQYGSYKTEILGYIRRSSPTFQMFSNLCQKIFFIAQQLRVATHYASAPASLTIISCKYENRQRLQFTTEFAKTRTTTTRKKISRPTVLFTKFMPTLSKQSKAQQNMGAGYAFFAHQTS